MKTNDIKPNYSELARIYNMDRRTIKKYYFGFEPKDKTTKRVSKLDKYQDLIKKVN